MNNPNFSPEITNKIATMPLGAAIYFPLANNSSLLVVIKEKSDLLIEIRKAPCAIGFRYLEVDNIMELTISPYINRESLDNTYLIPLNLARTGFSDALISIATTFNDLVVHYVSEDLNTQFTLSFLKEPESTQLLRIALERANLL